MSGKFWVLGAVLLLLVLGVPLLYVDSLVKSVFEEGASESFGERTSLGSVSLGLFSGRVGFRSLRIRNPEGFEADEFFRIGKGRFAVNLPTFMAETVEVPELVLEDVTLALEKDGGRSNYGKILENMGSAEPAPSSDEPAKGFVIQDLRIRDVTAQLRLAAPGGLGRSLDVEIPEIHLTNVGSESEGGMIASQLWGTILKAVMDSVVRSGGGVAGFVTGDLRGQLARLPAVRGEVIGEVTRKGAETAEAAGKEVDRRLEEVTGGAAQGVREELGGKAAEAARGLGGLLNRGDRD